MSLRVFKRFLRIQQNGVYNDYKLKKSASLKLLSQYQLTLTSLTFYVSGVSKRKHSFQFSFPAKADVCVMTDFVSFLSSGNFFGKIRN